MREELLSILEKNSRIDFKELAVMLGQTESVVLDEITKMEKDGVICGYHTLINWEKTSIEKVLTTRSYYNRTRNQTVGSTAYI